MIDPARFLGVISGKLRDSSLAVLNFVENRESSPKLQDILKLLPSNGALILRCKMFQLASDDVEKRQVLSHESSFLDTSPLSAESNKWKFG